MHEWFPDAGEEVAAGRSGAGGTALLRCTNRLDERGLRGVGIISVAFGKRVVAPWTNSPPE